METTQATRTELLAIIDTYEGMLSLCNNGEGADHLLVYLDRAKAALAALGGA